jgi:DNA-binding beta-propeller fold protein YncE
MNRTFLIATLCAAVLGGCASTPRGMAGADGSGGALFVANKRGNSLSKVDLATRQEVARVDACTNPHELATSPDDRHVALACYGGTSVDIFRTGDLQRVKSIDLGANARPHGIIWHTTATSTLQPKGAGRSSGFVIRSDKRSCSSMAPARKAAICWPCRPTHGMRGLPILARKP